MVVQTLIECVIALGGNVGDSERHFHSAIAAFPQHAIVVERASGLYRTAPVGGPPNQRAYLNAAVLATTHMSARETLQALHRIEASLGRVRDQRWGPRSIDLDLVLYGDQVIDAPDIRVPHPRMAHRRFVLEPAAEVASALEHPEIGWTLSRLRDHARAQPTRIAIWSSATSGLASAVSRQASEMASELGLLTEFEWRVSNEGASSAFAATDPLPQLHVLLKPSDEAPGADRPAHAKATRRGWGPWLALEVQRVRDASEEVVAAACALAPWSAVEGRIAAEEVFEP